MLKASADPVLGDAAPSHETEVVRFEEQENLLAAVEGLPARLPEVIECRYFLGLSEAETSRALGVAPGTVKSRSSRALERLRTVVRTPTHD